MEKFLRPDKFDTDPESPTAAEEWTHWLHTFEDFLTMTEFVNTEDKLKVLNNRLTFKVYKFVKDSKTYEAALEILNSIYVKPKNEIFGRFLVMTRKQQQGESIDQYVSELKRLSQDCVFESVNGAQYRDQYIRDAFINGIASSYIRQRLFENNTLELAEAVRQSRALEMAQAQIERYPQSDYRVQSCAVTESEKPDDQNDDRHQNETVSAIKKGVVKCYFCGLDKHTRDRCPARDVFCGKCKKIGHYARVCKSTPIQSSNKNHKNYDTSAALLASTSVLNDSLVQANVNDLKATCLIDTGSSSSFINMNFVQLTKYKCIEQLDMSH